MTTDYSCVPGDPDRLESFIRSHEQGAPVKPGSEATLIWADEGKMTTECALVYLHGFKASHPEGDPVHKAIAREFKCNLYLSRMREHGLTDENPLVDLTVDKLLDSAVFALEIGKRIGKKVILMGTSTGGSLGLYLASQEQYREHIAALVLYSPLIDFYGPSAKLLRSPFFRGILRVIPGPQFQIATPRLQTGEDRIWYGRYAFQGALALGEFVERYMQKETFQNVDCPVFSGYYHRNGFNRDKVVSVEAIQAMFSNLGGPAGQKELVNFPNANTHVICSKLLSNSADSLISATSKFISNNCFLST